VTTITITHNRTVKFIYSYLPVRDVQKSREWYAEIFGFEKFGELELRVSPTVLLTLIETKDDNKYEIKQDGKSLPIIGFCINEVDELHFRLRSNGINVTEIVRHNWGSTFEFLDLDGNKIEVWSGYSEEWSEK
jgi:catechol-2,3-dioxygenase